MQLPCPAKINRFLRLLGKRADGYHELETQFQFLQFADTLRFETRTPPAIRRVDRHPFALPKEDLSIRAAKLLQATYPQTRAHGVTITMHKVIPPGSGLGGGSSNAATTLLALNHLWQLGLTRRQLAELGLQLGADVPLFVHGRAAFARGVGEVLTPFDAHEQWLCVGLPPVQVRTAEVFAQPQLMRTHVNTRNSDYDYDYKYDRDRGSPPTANDLEPITTRLYPPIGAALACLRRYGEARMSGSGGAVYASFASRRQARQVAAQLPEELHAVVTKTVNRHPLLDKSVFRSERFAHLGGSGSNDCASGKD